MAFVESTGKGREERIRGRKKERKKKRK